MVTVRQSRGCIINNMQLDFLKNMSALEAAPRLLGCELERTLDDSTILRVKIVETEAYDQTDEASHSFRGETERTKVMFGEGGHLYVYFTYGMHYCANIVTGKKGEGAGVLLRAGEPLVGIEAISANRRGMTGKVMTNGPAKLTEALKIDFNLRGHDLTQAPLKLIIKPPLTPEQIISSPRIGISRAKSELRRFYIADNPYVSK